MHPDLQELCRVLSILYLKLQNSHFSVTRRTIVLFGLTARKEIASGVLEKWINGVIILVVEAEVLQSAKRKDHTNSNDLCVLAS